MFFCFALFASINSSTASISYRLPNGYFIDMLSGDCHYIHLIPLLLSDSSNNLLHILLNIPNWTHCWNRLWRVEPEPNSLGSIFHWHSVLRTYRMPFITFLKGIVGWLTVYFGFSIGKRSVILSHSSSEIVVTVDLFLFFCGSKAHFHKD